MNIQEALARTTQIKYYEKDPLVVQTVASELTKATNAKMVVLNAHTAESQKGNIFIAIANSISFDDFNFKQTREQVKEEFIYFQIKEDGSGKIIASRANVLFGFVCFLLEYMANEDITPFIHGKIISTSFKWHRPSYDYFLSQDGRVQRNLIKASYVRNLARLGFTHVEVNGLAYPMGLESGPKGETYPMFYTYCAAMDQFVYSELNKGLYPFYYLSANLANLKENARLAVKYGLTPGMLSFEPRSVPEQFFERYPMLRGARVDHPFRSFKPRYNMTITHPKVLAHYEEMMTKLMAEVPELGYLTIWSNDSGAGFEHTKSLYVGRNGGAYLIREWKDDEEIARLAGKNALNFFQVLKNAAAKVNPEFRVLTRMESFYGEHDIIWQGLGDGIEIETTSLVAKGWDMPYTHPKYPDSTAVTGGSVYQNYFDERERPHLQDLANKNAHAHFMFTVGPHILFDPLLGIPYPNLTFKRLKMLNDNGVDHLAHSGGSYPPELVPYNINHEILRLFQFKADMDIHSEITKLAIKWAGEKYFKVLVQAWGLTEEAIMAFPNVVPLYSGYGFCWYRLWVRPFIPNLEAVPASGRTFYEDHMCTTPHNPNNVDLSKDVLFKLTSQEKSALDVQRIDKNLWAPMDRAIEILESVAGEAVEELGSQNVISDQLVRLHALRCWFMTHRNVAAWIAGVHGYLSASNPDKKRRYRDMIREMMEKEIDNTKKVKALWRTGVEFMSVSGVGESPLMYGENFPELLDRRIKLMKQHLDDEPYINPNYIEDKAGEMMTP